MDPSINRLRAIAILGVVLLHAAGSFLYTSPSTIDWKVGDFFDGLARYCVPLFIMITGALLLGKDEPIGVFYKKRASKIILPFLVWSVFYYAYKQAFDVSNMSVYDFLEKFVTDDIYYHLWYFYLLIGLYLLIPLLRKIAQHTDTKTLLLFSLAFILIDNAYQFSTVYLELAPKKYITTIFSYIGYLFVGYAIYKKQALQPYKRTIYPVAVISLLAIIVGTYFLSSAKGSYDGFLFRYTSVTVFIYSIAIMIFFSNKGNTSKLTNMFATHSFGIYLTHPFIMTGLKEALKPYELSAIISIPIVFTVSLLISSILTFLISKVPYLKKTI